MLARTTTTAAVVPTPSKTISSLKEAITSKTPRDTKSPSEFATPSPGSFRHPRMTEIITRQSATSFTAKNVQIAALNLVVIVGTIVLGGSIRSLISTIITYTQLETFSPGPAILLNLFRLYLLSNVILALRQRLPYLGRKDTMSDIPLTPSQRALLGLPPSQNSAPTTGVARDIITPPRYRRSSSSLAGTPQTSSTERRSISANYSSSPLSTSRNIYGFSPSSQAQSSRRASGSPFSPNSPLLHRALTSSSARGDLLNFGDSVQSNFEAGTSTASNRGLGRSQSLRERPRRGQEEPGTPSPGGKRQPGLNYKWLYEKGYKMPLDGSVGY